MKKRIVGINSHYGGSTGTIMRSILKFSSNDFDTFYATADCPNTETSFRIQPHYLARQLGKVVCQSFGIDGFWYRNRTAKLIAWLDRVHPDLLHLHNVHGYYINIDALLMYAYRHRVPVVWTLHDCWAFTGRCAHFDMVGCPKWENGCGCCPYKDGYPRTRFFDFSERQLKEKKRLFTGHNINFISPSLWLATLFGKSELKGEEIKVINNGIDFSVFHPKTKLLVPGLNPGKKTILAVGYPFTPEKGINYVNTLDSVIDHTKFQILAVGVQRSDFTAPGVIRFGPVFNRDELASLYSSADVFVCFSLEENYPTVILESLACGTPVVSFDTGGCKEPIISGKNGFFVPKKDVESAYKKIKEACSLSRDDCSFSVHNNSEQNFCKKYFEIYKNLLKHP